MTWPKTRRDIARHPLVWVAVAVLALALVAAGVLWATRGTAPRPSAGPTRAVALGDSVPYGHGLHNPYLTPQVGLPAGWVSQGPALTAYPTQVARALGLTMTVRTSNCVLTGDQLAISGAVVDPANNTSLDGQCPRPPQQARNLGDEVDAADLAQHPARLVLLQDGADDINFAACLEHQLAQALMVNLGLGTACVENGTVTPGLATKLADVRTGLARAIEDVAPHSRTVAVLDYYQPIPDPSEIADDVAASGGRTNLVCTGLRANAASTFAAAQVVLAALNGAITGAVSDARADHVTNVRLIGVAGAVDGHGACTADPWVFSGEPVPDSTLAADSATILAASACTGISPDSCGALTARSAQAQRNLEGYVWRAVHPNAAGQRAIATLVERQLGASR